MCRNFNSRKLRTRQEARTSFFILFHALLHIIGYMHDKEDAIFMENKETNFLNQLV